MNYSGQDGALGSLFFRMFEKKLNANPVLSKNMFGCEGFRCKGLVQVYSFEKATEYGDFSTRVLTFPASQHALYIHSSALVQPHDTDI